MKKFNAKLGREVTYNFYPNSRFVIVKINNDRTINIALGHWNGWQVLNVPFDKVCR